jgi:hypothetical protein
MKVVVIALLVAGSAAFAQRQNPNPAGFGSVLYPGTGGPPPARVPNGGFGSVLHPGTGGPPGRGFAPRNFIPPPAAHPAHGSPLHGQTVIVPYPVYYGGTYYDPSAGYANQPAPAYDDPGSYSAPSSQPPVVIMNQGFRPEPQAMYPPDAYQPPPQYQPEPQPTIYLIAMQDHTILPALAYWVEGDTLTYITSEGDQNRVSLSLVDRDFSKQLNDERHVEFKLPKQ